MPEVGCQKGRSTLSQSPSFDDSRRRPAAKLGPPNGLAGGRAKPLPFRRKFSGGDRLGSEYSYMDHARRMRAIIAWTLFALAPLVAAPVEAADVLVVCPAAFRAALAPWESYRQQQGHQLQVIEPPATAAELRTAIRHVASENQLRFVVLVGDVRHAASDTAVVPTGYAKAQVNVRWGSEPTIATDQTLRRSRRRSNSGRGRGTHSRPHAR